MPHDTTASRSEQTCDDRSIRLLTLALLVAGIVVLPLYAAVMARQRGLGEAWVAVCAAIGIPPGS